MPLYPTAVTLPYCAVTLPYCVPLYPTVLSLYPTVLSLYPTVMPLYPTFVLSAVRIQVAMYMEFQRLTDSLDEIDVEVNQFNNLYPELANNSLSDYRPVYSCPAISDYFVLVRSL